MFSEELYIALNILSRSIANCVLFFSDNSILLRYDLNKTNDKDPIYYLNWQFSEYIFFISFQFPIIAIDSNPLSLIGLYYALKYSYDKKYIIISPTLLLLVILLLSLQCCNFLYIINKYIKRYLLNLAYSFLPNNSLRSCQQTCLNRASYY